MYYDPLPSSCLDRLNKTVQEVYALGTILGIRGIGRGDQIGSIAERKLADVIVFDALTPNMTG